MGSGRARERGTCMQPRKPRRTDTLSSDTPPTTRLLIRSPGSWFPICTVSCAKRGAGPLPVDTRLGSACSEAETQPRWALPKAWGVSLPHTGGHSAISMDSTAVYG